MAAKLKIVLFEDTAETRSDLTDALRDHFRGEVEVWPPTQSRETAASGEERMYEDRITDFLQRPPYAGATLLLADRNLAKSPNFIGLSVAAVAGAAGRLAIPICSYARQPATDEYEWRGRWQEGHIVLNYESDEEMARKGVLAAKGFDTLMSSLPKALRDKTNDSPAKVLAAVLGKPEYADKIALYGVGDQLSAIPPKPKEGKRQRVKRMGCFLGYWLWDSLLRYPGLLVNETAAASHLNIALKDFGKPAIRAVFKKALYRGPFADPRHPQWWRGILDDIVSSKGFDDGLALARQAVGGKIDFCRCSVDSSKPAGYYCIISKKPVNLENSKGGLSWFPRGADLTRISNKKFEEFGPWLGA
jgi:hypothetical protein